ncbi:MAG: hypothetical protein K2F72_03935 [Muribaculaceae bacterium]|nr:hypothetical protein [Muribaculaceae bacterium]
MKKSLAYVALAALMVLAASCGALKGPKMPKNVEVTITVYAGSVPETFRDLDKNIRIVVETDITGDDQMYGYGNAELPAYFRKFAPHYTFTPSVEEFGQEATTAYMQQMRFDISPSADYTLWINVKELKIEWLDKSTVEATCRLTYRVTNEARETIVPTATASSKIKLGQLEQFGIGLGRAYADALGRVDWSRIAACLKVADTPKQEKNAQVTGAGDTALEHSVIRWYIISTPQGADVSWRVVSSTPDVANTNSNYVGTTPYESTESFDIRGLTYNNSGNVQIEVTCEKAGYLTQRKRFNLRQAIDQKEISAKFNLIKDE